MSQSLRTEVARFAIETLKNRGVLAVDGEHFHAMFARFAHDDFARHDQNFFGGNGDIFARANRGQGGFEPSSADDRR